MGSTVVPDGGKSTDIDQMSYGPNWHMTYAATLLYQKLQLRSAVRSQ